MQSKNYVSYGNSGNYHITNDRLRFSRVSFVVIFLFLVFITAFEAQGQITVDRSDDTAAASACTAASNDCSLRGAFAYADSHSGTTINIPAGAYNLTIDELRLGSSTNVSTTISGAGAAATTINQTIANRRVIDLNPTLAANVTVNISGVRIAGGNSPSDNFGGGGLIGGGPGNTLNLNNCTFENNTNNAGMTPKGGAVEWAGGGVLNINNCTFNNNTVGSGAANRGVGGGVDYNLLNNSGAAGQGGLTITNSTFTNNQAGAQNGGGGGVYVTVTTTQTPRTVTITNNTFTGNQANASSLAYGGAIVSSGSSAITVKFNRIVGNIAASGATGIYQGNGTIGTIDATENWWGCNAGPGNAGCDSIGGDISDIDATPRIVLTHTANTNPIVTGQSTVLTASFLRDSDGGVLTTANISELIGLPIVFNNPTRGTLSSAQTTIQASGTATVTFTANAVGAGSASATVDNQTSVASITINKANTTTTITSDTPDPSSVGQNVVVTYTVTVNSPGAGTPTGNVTVSDGVNSCTGTISAGQCTLNLSTLGTRNLTATYGGDTNFAGSVSAGVPHQVCGTSIVVTSTGDSGAGTLRQAIADVCSNGTISFSPTFNSAQTVILTSGELLINKNLTLSGTGANLLTINANNTGRAFLISGGTVNLSGLRITGGNAANGGSGGGIANVGGTLTLSGSIVTGNTAPNFGGGIYSSSPATIINSTIFGNTANNSAGATGGGIHSVNSLTLINTTVSGNTVSSGNNSGGGIRAEATTSIINATITNNSASGSTSASGIFRSAGTATIRNSIIAANQNNAVQPDAVGAFDSASAFNLIGNVGTATGFSVANQNQTGTSASPLNPQLAPLTNNGGTTPTHNLLSNSPAIDKGGAANVPFAEFILPPLTQDQRGLTRPVDLPSVPNATGGDGSDIGAVEVQVATAANVSISGRVLTADGRGLRNAFVTLTDSSGSTRSYKTTSFGFYEFGDIEIGETYVLRVSSKQFTFVPQIVTTTDDVTELNVIALE